MNENDFFNGQIKSDKGSTTLTENTPVLKPQSYQNDYYLYIRNSEIKKIRERSEAVKNKKGHNWHGILGTLSGAFFGAYAGYAFSIGKLVSDDTIMSQIGTVGMLVGWVATMVGWFFTNNNEIADSKAFAEFVLDTLIEEGQQNELK
ncbi:hypothetical protein [Weissella soli]|uniref:Uncharacterized protein n=1 Tax=Weissella soli TaxID=155866 RepID=A0A288QL60_9LACO|nr:hypothetical protein [Weissella soli]AOT55866.1 hypothetical protein WSWS_00213 [Weissella soli]NKY83678.1 hypothetical protein [Weissella soli]RDL06460.1 hypothetical protein DFP99_0838 [Weissella soli]GEN93488.1 hypothetical protein WSO01_11000 [Weissella soli]